MQCRDSCVGTSVFKQTSRTYNCKSRIVFNEQYIRCVCAEIHVFLKFLQDEKKIKIKKKRNEIKERMKNCALCALCIYVST